MKKKGFRSTLRLFFTKARIYKNKATALAFHSFGKYIFTDKAKHSRKIVINSHINYYEKTCNTLIHSLTKHGIKKKDIILMVGGRDCVQKFDFEGVESYFLNNNSIDYTALIGIVELNLTDNIDHFFYIHDTALVNSNKFSSMFYKYPIKSKFTYSIGTFVSMNIGFYSKESLIKHKDLILSAKNTDYSYEAVYKSKVLGVKMEDAIFKANSECHKTIFSGYSMPTEKKVEYVGQARIEESYSSIGILKYKANKNISENFVVSLTE